MAARLAAWRTSERALGGDLLSELGPGMLVIADRGFYNWQLWQAAAATGADLLWRMQSGPNLPVVRAFPDGSYESFLLDPKVRGRRANQRHRGARRGSAGRSALVGIFGRRAYSAGALGVLRALRFRQSIIRLRLLTTWPRVYGLLGSMPLQPFTRGRLAEAV